MIKKQHGVTLIELMVSMMLGLALITGLSQLFVQSQSSFKLQRNLSDMTDDAVFVLEDLTKGLLLAGYSQSGAKDYPSITSTIFSISGSPVVSTISFSNINEFFHGADELSNNRKGDQFVYRYKLNDANELENSICTNTAVLVKAYNDEIKNANDNSRKVNAIVMVRMYKENDNSSFVFYCKSAVMTPDNPDSKIKSTVEDAQPMISNVEKLTFKYGVKTTAGLFYYGKSADVSDWTKVFAVKVFIVMQSADKNLTRIKTGWSIDGGATEYPLVDEKRLYKVFSKTIFLRNAP
ncbi:MAG: prepilin-type N-terminal cleavage/methylation domain-containing protein [Methylococcaceae bacterium]|nr:prepilin-type N-terminal cleavage/methylation domain-containing protein [Methylococcaceae bacterium]